MDSFEREEQILEDEYNDGNLSLKQYNAAMRDLRSDYRAAADEAAQDAYDEEFSRW